MTYRTLLLALALAVAAGCSSPVGPEEDGAVMSVVGQLTAEGVECPALRSDRGTLFTLVGDLKGFKAGDRVLVEGRVAQVSVCMQGTTLQVESIRPAQAR